MRLGRQTYWPKNFSNRFSRLISILQGLHYKDYHLVAAPAAIEPTPAKSGPHTTLSSSAKDADNTWSFEEIDTVKEFGKQMEEKGVLEWWRKAMDFTS